MAHRWFVSTRRASSVSYTCVSSLVATKNRHGCSFADEGDHRAASKTLSSLEGSTGRAENERGLQRRLKRSVRAARTPRRPGKKTSWRSKSCLVLIEPPSAPIQAFSTNQKVVVAPPR